MVRVFLVDDHEVVRRGLIDLLSADEELQARGFAVGDSKAHHLIVRSDQRGGLRRDTQGRVLYGLVDFELLARTPQREEAVRKTRRHAYLRKQADRFRHPPVEREALAPDMC